MCHRIYVFYYLNEVKTLYSIIMQYIIEVVVTSEVVLHNHAHIQTLNQLLPLLSLEANLIGDHVIWFNCYGLIRKHCVAQWLIAQRYVTKENVSQWHPYTHHTHRTSYCVLSDHNRKQLHIHLTFIHSIYIPQTNPNSIQLQLSLIYN